MLKRRLLKFLSEWSNYLINGFMLAMWLTALISSLLDPKGTRGHVAYYGIMVGVYVGVGGTGIVYKFTNRRREKWRQHIAEMEKEHEKFDRKMWELDTEARIRAQYAKAPSAAQPASSGLEDYS